jgi:MFS family permease
VRLGDDLQVLRRRDFRLLFLGQGVSVLGDRMVAVALAFAVIHLGGSESEVGLVLAVGWAPLVLTILAGGVVADRTSRRAVMVAADLVRIVSQGTMAVLIITGVAEIWMLAALAGVTGAATGLFNPASTGLLPEVVADDELQPANALRSAAISGSEILGPALAGVLVATVGAGWAIGVDAATFAISAICLALLRPPARERRERASFFAELREGWVAFRSRRWVWTVVACTAVVNMAWGAWSALGPTIAENDLGGPAVWGTVLAVVGVGALAGSLVATRVRPLRPLVLFAWSGGVFGLPLAFLAAAAPAPLLALSAFISGVALMLGGSVWFSTLQRHVPDEWLSRVSAYDWFGSYAFYPLGLALSGVLAGAIGIHETLWLAFGLLVVSSAGLLALPDIRNFREAPADARVA